VLTRHAADGDAMIPYERVRAAVADNPIATKAGNVSFMISFGVKTWRADGSEDELLAALSAIRRGGAVKRRYRCDAV